MLLFFVFETVFYVTIYENSVRLLLHKLRTRAIVRNTALTESTV